MKTNRDLLMHMICLVSALGSSSVFAQMHDPTRPSSYEESSDPWQLTTIFFSSTHRAAIIGGKILQEGDVVNGQRVKKIESNSVTLQGSQGEKVILLIEKPIKQPSN